MIQHNICLVTFVRCDAGAVITANTIYGAIYGMESFAQLVESAPATLTNFVIRGAPWTIQVTLLCPCAARLSSKCIFSPRGDLPLRPMLLFL